jgi:hypothetical protein
MPELVRVRLVQMPRLAQMLLAQPDQDSTPQPAHWPE